MRRRFYDAMKQEALLDVERALIQSRQADQELAERLFSLAANSRVDVLNAQLGVEQQRLAVRQQERARAQALLALRTAIGEPDLPPVAPGRRRRGASGVRPGGARRRGAGGSGRWSGAPP